MKLQLVTAEYVEAVEAPLSPIAALNNEIATRLAEIRKMPSRGFAGAYKRALDDVNRLIDEYIELRQPRRVK